MTRFFRPNGSALLTLVAALLLATWPFFGTFTIGALIAGFFLSLAMRSWYREHPSTVAVPARARALGDQPGVHSRPRRWGRTALRGRLGRHSAGAAAAALVPDRVDGVGRRLRVCG